MSVAIFQLETHGADKRVAAILTDTIVSQVSRIPDAEVIGSKEIDAMLNYEQKKQMAGCDDTSCAVALGGALGVDKILMGSIGRLGKSQVLDLKLVDIRKATIDTSFNRRLVGDQEDEFLDIMPEALATLFPWADVTWTPKKGPGAKAAGAGAAGAGAAGVGAAGARSAESARAPRPPVAAATTGVSSLKDRPPYLVWSLVSYGTAALLTGGGAMYYKWADDTRNSAPGMTYEELNDAYRTKTLGTWLFFGTAGAAFATGTVLLILDMQQGPQSAKAAAAPAGGFDLRPFLGVGGAGVMGTW